MWLAILDRGIWWELAIVGTTLLNVIDGGKKSRSIAPGRTINLGSVLHALPDAVLLCDDRGRILDLNRAAEDLTGQSSHAVLGRSAVALLQSRLEENEGLHSLFDQARRGESVRSTQKVFRCPNGDTMRVVVSLCGVRDQAGRTAGVLLTIQDVTELAALQRHSDATERHVAVGQMTAGLMHDFNNVLNTINEAVTVLEHDHAHSDRDQTVLNIIGNAVQYGADTIRNTREYLLGSKEQSSRVEMRHLLDEVLELAHPLLKTHTRVQIVRQTQDCGFVNANADDLRRAFTNLVLNALDAMPQGGTLSIGCQRVDSRIVISVRDTGVGIPHEAQRKIFSPYYTTKSKGTGLGLAGARRAITAQRGEIRFESIPGQGTTFYVTLPMAADAEGLAPSAA